MLMTTVTICGVETNVPVSWKKWVDYMARIEDIRRRAHYGTDVKQLHQQMLRRADELHTLYRRDAGMSC